MAIGIHTGEPMRADDRYVGLDVHVAARICSAAHGGQVVVSQAARDVALDSGSDLSFRYLGDHRLKHVPTTQTLYQLVGPGLAEDFPPLSALGGSTLPALHHRLVGRRDDLAATQALLARPDIRLVTIAGPGGAGKSRLALEAASEAAAPPAGSPRRAGSDLRRHARPCRDREHRRRQGVTGNVAHGTAGRGAGRNRSAARARQHGASARRDCGHRHPARPSLRSRHPHHEPLSTADQSRACRSAFLTADRGRHDPVLRACRSARSAARRRIARGRRGDLPAARRPSPCDRAGHRPARAARARATPVRAGRRARTRDGGLRRLPGASADAARDARLELRAAHSRPAAAARPTRGLRGRQRARGRGGRRRVCGGGSRRPRGSRRGEPASARGRRRARAAIDARNRARGCGRTPRCGGDARRVPAAATQSTFSGSRNGPRRASPARSRRTGSIGWRTSSTTSGRHSTGASRTGGPRTRWRRSPRWGASGALTAMHPRLAESSPVASTMQPTFRRMCEPERFGPQPTKRWRNRTIAEAIPALEEALALFRELGDSRHAVFALCEIARALSSRDELEQAYEAGQTHSSSRRAAATTGRAPQHSTPSPWSRATANDTSSPRSTASGVSRCGDRSATRS